MKNDILAEVPLWNQNRRINKVPFGNLWILNRSQRITETKLSSNLQITEWEFLPYNIWNFLCLFDNVLRF
jgi:hypothetical protein